MLAAHPENFILLILSEWGIPAGIALGLSLLIIGLTVVPILFAAAGFNVLALTGVGKTIPSQPCVVTKPTEATYQDMITIVCSHFCS